MPIVWTLAEHAVLLARDNDDDNLRQFQDNDENNSNSHRRLEIGVIVAIVVAGLAIIGFTATCVVKRRERAAKRTAKAAIRQVIGVEEDWYGDAGKGDVEMKIVEEGKADRAKKVAFVSVGEAEAPPSYLTAVMTKEEGK